MDCILCQRLESKLKLLERAHSEKLRTLRSNMTASGEAYSRLTAAETKARLDMECARSNIRQHKEFHTQAFSA